MRVGGFWWRYGPRCLWGCLTDHSGERLNGIQEVSGSIPLISTKNTRFHLKSSVFLHLSVCFVLGVFTLDNKWTADLLNFFFLTAGRKNKRQTSFIQVSCVFGTWWKRQANFKGNALESSWGHDASKGKKRSAAGGGGLGGRAKGSLWTPKDAARRAQNWLYLRSVRRWSLGSSLRSWRLPPPFYDCHVHQHFEGHAPAFWRAAAERDMQKPYFLV